MTKVINWMLFFAVLAVLAVYGGSEAQPAKTPPPAWDATETRQEVEAEVAWMKRMNAVEAEQAARDQATHGYSATHRYTATHGYQAIMPLYGFQTSARRTAL